MEKFTGIVRLRVCRDGVDGEAVFGRGTAMLLRGIEEEKSLNKAAAKIGMAYSKAWKSISATEEYLGFRLIDRLGAHGSVLTDMGRRFLAIYEEAERCAQSAVDEVLKNSEFD